MISFSLFLLLMAVATIGAMIGMHVKGCGRLRR